MMEAIVLMCLAAAPEVCREVLLPGPCAEAVVAPPDGLVAGPVRCVAATPGVTVEEVAPGVFVFSGAVAEPSAENLGAVSNAGFIVGDERVAVVDTLGARAAGEGLYRALREVTDKPISHVILTHMHPDHVYGASIFAEAGAAVVGHPRLGRALAERAGAYGAAMERLIGAEGFLGSVLPEVVPAPREIDLGGRRLRLMPHGLAHTVTDMTLLDEATGVLFAGDLVFNRHTPALDGSLTGWQAVLDDLEARMVVPGHGAPVLAWPEGGADTRRYLAVLAEETRAAIAEGARMSAAVETVGRSEAGRWGLFELFHPRNVTAAFAELEWE